VAFTTLIVENLTIGFLTWVWIIVLSIRVGNLTNLFDKICAAEQFAKVCSTDEFIKLIAATDLKFAWVVFVVVVLVYPLGVMMNSVSYDLAGWLLAKRMNKPLLESVGAKSLNEVYVYVLQYGSPALVGAIQVSNILAMRVSRATALNLSILSIVSLSWATLPALLFAGVSASAAYLGYQVYKSTVRDWKSELFAAYQLLRQAQTEKPPAELKDPSHPSVMPL
jgi:hypothetical protein